MFSISRILVPALSHSSMLIVPAQVKLLKILASLGAGDKAASDNMYTVIQQVSLMCRKVYTKLCQSWVTKLAYYKHVPLLELVVAPAWLYAAGKISSEVTCDVCIRL